MVWSCSFFFFQAEDGIRDVAVTGVQTCALPISGGHLPGGVGVAAAEGGFTASTGSGQPTASTLAPAGVLGHWSMPSGTPSRSVSNGQPLASTVAPAGVLGHLRSEERRVGKECRSRW